MALPKDDAQTIRSLRDLVGQVADESLKNRLETKVDDVEKTMTDKEVTSADKDAKVARLERKAALVRLFLDRESVATTIGGILLLLLAIVLTVAMFTEVAASSVISNSFLLILGYFFGQARTVVGDSGRDREI